MSLADILVKGSPYLLRELVVLLFEAKSSRDSAAFLLQDSEFHPRNELEQLYGIELRPHPLHVTRSVVHGLNPESFFECQSYLSPIYPVV